LANKTITANFSVFADWNEQLRRARTNGGDARAFFTRRLRAAQYFVPRRQGGNELSLLATQENKYFLPAFTSEDEFVKWTQPSNGFAVLPFEMLHHIVVDNPKLCGVVINPFGLSLILNRAALAETESAATGMSHELAEHKGKMFIETAKYRPELARAFAAALKSSGMNVRKAYILMTRQEHDPKGHLLFLIDFSGDNKLLFPHIAKAVKPYIGPGAKFELLRATPATLNIARRKALPIRPSI
jgi:hypothetical protein